MEPALPRGVRARSEGTDTLSGIEKIDGAGSANILLVGNGGYATIQAAVDGREPPATPF